MPENAHAHDRQGCHLQNDTTNQALPWTEVTANIDKMQRAAVQVEANQLSSSKVTSFVFVAGVAIATWQPVPPARLNHIDHKTTLTCELHLSPNQAPGPTAKALLSDLGSLDTLSQKPPFGCW